jgi:type III restriction enzyme
LGFAIPYLHNGQPHDYTPDFIVRLKSADERYLIIETKGFDPLREIKAQAAQRWVAAVNNDGAFGQWNYSIVDRVSDVVKVLADAV